MLSDRVSDNKFLDSPRLGLKFIKIMLESQSEDQFKKLITLND